MGSNGASGTQGWLPFPGEQGLGTGKGEGVRWGLAKDT